MTEKAFSLLELLVSLLIFEVVVASSMSEVCQYIKNSRENQLRTEAAGAAQMVLDELRSLDPAALPAGGTGPERFVSTGSHTFTVTSEYCANAALCTGSSIRHIRVTVSRTGRVWYAVDTAYAQLR